MIPTELCPDCWSLFYFLMETWQVIASRLLLSKQTIPHYYLTVDTSVDKLMEWDLFLIIRHFLAITVQVGCWFERLYMMFSLRGQLNTLQEASGRKRISVNDLVIKVCYTCFLEKQCIMNFLRFLFGFYVYFILRVRDTVTKVYL